MESLVATYASSDEEEEQETTQSSPPLVPTSSSSPLPSSLLFSSLPNPRPSTSSSSSSSSVFASLPQPRQQQFRPDIASVVEEDNNNYVSDPKPSVKTKTSASSLFSALPQPKTLIPDQHSSELPIPKKVVQFRPPIVPSATSQLTHDSDDEEEERERNRRKEAESQIQSSSVRSFLSSIPAPRNSSSSVLGGGLLPSAAASSRRSIIETQAPAAANSAEVQIESENGTAENYANYQSSLDQSAESYVSYGGYESGEINQNVAFGDASTYGNYYGDYGTYGDHVDYGQYANNWADGSAAAAVQETAGSTGKNAVGMLPKRKRNEVPTEIVEVKQDELIKNRPREDQVKLTGVAFGPSYQPASTKGKPSKLHKRKHQIGSLYFDMKQKEMELAERRSRGLLTKAETHAKYGW